MHPTASRRGKDITSPTHNNLQFLPLSSSITRNSSLQVCVMCTRPRWEPSRHSRSKVRATHHNILPLRPPGCLPHAATLMLAAVSLLAHLMTSAPPVLAPCRKLLPTQS